MLSEVQRLLVQACHERDPKRALDAALATADLTEAERAWLGSMDQDGLAITGLIVKKLRFERVVLGDEDLGKLFDADPAAFAQRFERYCAEVPPEAVFPGDEAAAYRSWVARALSP